MEKRINKEESLNIKITNDEINKLLIEIKDSNYIDPHKNKILIPELAFNYFPPEEYKIKLNKKNNLKSQRLIFETDKPLEFYQDFENTELSKLKDHLQKQNKLQDIVINDAEILRFFQANNYKIEKTITAIFDHQNWIKTKLPIKLNKAILEILNSGFIYIQGRDYCFRPIIIMKLDVYLKHKNKYSFEDWNNAVLFLFEYTKNNLFIPGQIENWVTIANLENCSLLTLPSDLKKIINEMQDHYRSRLANSFVIGLSSFITIVFNIVKGLLEETTRDKIHVIKDREELQLYISTYQIEEEYKGKCKFDTQHFPPQFDRNRKDHACLPKQVYEKVINKENKESISFSKLNINDNSNSEEYSDINMTLFNDIVKIHQSHFDRINAETDLNRNNLMNSDFLNKKFNLNGSVKIKLDKFNDKLADELD